MSTTNAPPLAPPPPGPRRRAAPYWLRRMGQDILATFDALAEQYGDVAMVRLGNQRIVVLRGAEAARHVLVTAQDRYPKAQQFDLFRPALGLGLVTSSGERWRTSRRMVQPLFAKRQLGPYADHMAAAATAALDRWEARWPAGHVVDLDTEILHVGLDTVGRALVSHDFSSTADRFEGAMANALHEIGAMSRSPGVFVGQDLGGVGIVRAARLTTPRRWRRYVAEARSGVGVIEALVDERFRDGHGDRDDLLRLLMETVDEDSGQRLERRQVVDEVMTFIAAGHETTAHGLSWMFLLLARNPEARERLHAEVDEVLGGRVPTVEDADRLPWLVACFQEAMRIYPPAWHVPRVAAEDDVVGGYLVPQGARVMVSIWSTHRDPAVYPDPTAFRPERWLGDAAKDRPRFAYLPFGGGRRACIGQGFAMLNATILGAMIAQRYAFDTTSDKPIALEPTITLRPRDGIPMAVRKRVGVPVEAVG